MTSKSGLLLIDKAGAWTSHDVVAKVRGILKTRRVGHAGTLDPMATGLLILGVNNATKLLTFIVGETKTYLATIRLGASTITDDAEGEVTAQADSASLEAVTDELIRAEIAKLTGEIMQVPSSVSAIKVNGERAYAKVRSGDEVKLAARPVTVSKFEILEAPKRGGDFIDIAVEIDCSSGTYIRALARDLGNSLGVGGHLTALRRTRIGAYHVEDAVSFEKLTESGEACLLDVAAAATAQFAKLQLSEQDEIDLRHGKRIQPPVAVTDSVVAAINADGSLVAMLEPVGKQLKSVVVFQSEESK